MRVHILDPQLNLAEGHYAIYDVAVAAELRSRGIETVLYGTARSRATALAVVEAEPLFSHGMFDEVANDPLTWALENFVKLGRDFRADLSKIAVERFRSGDLAFFPNIIQYQISGVRDWIVELPPACRPNLVLKPSYLTYAMPYLQSRANKEIVPLLYRFSMRQLATDHPRTFICTDTDEMVKQFARLSGLPVHLLPLPLLSEEGTAQERSGPAVVTYLGHASMLKGFHLLPEVLKRVLADGIASHFVIQSYGDPGLRTPVEQALSAIARDKVTLIVGTVDAQTYKGLLQQADIVLLPYVREFYGWASSGIFSEAMSLGKVTVVTEGTWPAQQLVKFGGGGVTFRNLDVESVAGAIGRAVSELPRLKERAALATPAWRRHHSPAALVDHLLGFVEANAPPAAAPCPD
jgi:glycosyltransferase involved in cell wall biosynthesis